MRASKQQERQSNECVGHVGLLSTQRSRQTELPAGILTDPAQAVGKTVSMGVASGDVDADGDLDLFVTGFDDESDTLYVNQGGGVFRSRGPASAGASGRRPSCR